MQDQPAFGVARRSARGEPGEQALGRSVEPDERDVGASEDRRSASRFQAGGSPAFARERRGDDDGAPVERSLDDRDERLVDRSPHDFAAEGEQRD
jgi:hypothetical protein